MLGSPNLEDKTLHITNTDQEGKLKKEAEMLVIPIDLGGAVPLYQVQFYLPIVKRGAYTSTCQALNPRSRGARQAEGTDFLQGLFTHGIAWHQVVHFSYHGIKYVDFDHLSYSSDYHCMIIYNIPTLYDHHI